MTSLRDRKSQLRRELRGRVLALSEPEREAASASLRKRLVSLLATGFPESSETRPLVATFAGLRDEPDLVPLLAMPGLGVRWCFPRVRGGELTFHPIASQSDLAQGSFGIREPGATAPEIAIDSIDLFLVPGLGFDPVTGVRLGRGKGFYDRALALARPDAERLGIGFSCQLVEGLPAESHDVPLSRVLTEEDLIPDSNNLWTIDRNGKRDSSLRLFFVMRALASRMLRSASVR